MNLCQIANMSRTQPSLEHLEAQRSSVVEAQGLSTLKHSAMKHNRGMAPISSSPSHPRQNSALTIPAALKALAERGASPTPLLIDHSAGPRIELSGRVLVNWWAKNCGLLEMEFGLSPGDTVCLDVPPHWRTLPLALAALSLGATVTDRAEDADLVITNRPSEHMSAPEVLAVTLEALAVSFPGDLPEGMVDHAAEVRAQPDALTFSAANAAQASWDVDGVDSASLEHLLAAEAADGADASVSWLAVGGANAERGWSAAVASLLACQPEGSLVLVAPDALVDGAPADTLRTQERITRAATA